MNILFVTATRNLQSNQNKSELINAFNDQLKIEGRTAELKVIFNNTEKLSTVYNRFITPEYKDYYIVFLHDDITLNVLATVYELKKAFKQYDIIGLAGCTRATLSSPALWHLMAAKNCLSGAVAHPIAKDSEYIHMSAFGPYPQRCLMMDGLFLGVNINKLLEKNVKFDESNPAIAHFYDLDFCLNANGAQLKMGTWPIYVTHCSPGLLSTDDIQWEAAEKWFLNKWGGNKN